MMGVDPALCAGSLRVNSETIELALWIWCSYYTLKLVNISFVDVLADFLAHIMILTRRERVPPGNLRTYFSPNFSVICIILVSVDAAQKNAEDIVARISIFVDV